MCRIRSVYFFRILRRFGHIVLFFLPFITYIWFHEKRTEHISFLVFETNFLKQDPCDNNKTDACARHPVDINML